MESEQSGAVFPLPTGIPQLDDLLSYRHFAKDAKGCLDTATSLTVLGEDGTGKSVLALHVAAAYVNIALTNDKLGADAPLVIYLSTDLRYSAAKTVWDAFLLEYPCQRYVPFMSHEDVRDRRDLSLDKNRGRRYRRIQLQHCSPYPADPASAQAARMTPLADFIHDHFDLVMTQEAGTAQTARIAFVDMALKTTGDDWLYAARLLASIDRAASSSPHLLVMDSVAGFETLIGNRNSFGEDMSRRARIAQLVRAAGERWHTVFVVEEGDGGVHQPEEYVSDTVFHLRRGSGDSGMHRSIEVEKSRGRPFGAGRHPFELRSGEGSSTGDWENADDPRAKWHSHDAQIIAESRGESAPNRELPARPFNSYIQVYQSLDYLNHRFSAQFEPRSPRSEDRASLLREGFGIPFLDDMLGVSVSNCAEVGLAQGTVCALIGEGETKKEALAEEFLLQASSTLPATVAFALCHAKSWIDGQAKRRGSGPSFVEFVRSAKNIKRARDCARRFQPLGRHLDGLATKAAHWLEKFEGREREMNNFAADQRWGLPEQEDEVQAARLVPLAPRWDLESSFRRNDVATDPTERAFVLALAMLRSHSGFIDPVVLVTTHDKSATALAERAVTRCSDNLLRVFGEFNVARSDAVKPVSWDLFARALRRAVERNTLVRRLDAMQISAAELWHIVAQHVVRARQLAGLKEDDASALGNAIHTSSSGSVRVVISDLRLLRDIYPTVAADPLFLSTMVFRLRRYGVTSVLVDSDNGRPDGPPTHPSNWALRSLVDRQIYTWKVPFFGEQRVAITVSPPIVRSAAGVIRELVNKRSSPEAGTLADERIDVDSRFELYAGLEKGEPVPIPLRVILYRETERFARYVEGEKRFLAQLFPGSATEPILENMDTDEYRALRDYCQVPTDTKLPYTLIFAVDGYWALGRDTSLRNQRSYLFDPFNDFFAFFPNPNGVARPAPNRHAYFERPVGASNKHYASRIPEQDELIDRVPFTWDFGFLLCDERQWKIAEDAQLRPRVRAKALDGAPRFDTVGRVWDGLKRLSVLQNPDETYIDEGVRLHDGQLPTKGKKARKAAVRAPVVGWRDFFEATTLIAGRRSKELPAAPAFDVAVTLPDALLTLVFEVLASEIVADANRLKRHIAHLETLGLAMVSERRPSKLARVKLDELITFATRWVDQARTAVRRLSAKKYRVANSDDTDERKGRLDLVEFLCGCRTSRHEGVLEQFTRAAGDNPIREYFGESFDDAAFIDRHQDDGAVDSVNALLLQWNVRDSGYALQLYKTWLLLLEVLDLEKFLDVAHGATLEPDLPVATDAVAARHWYKSAVVAVPATPNVASASSIRSNVPVRLPGHFSVRGDWFLAVAKGSRSDRLADMALDVLTSRRANRTRLALGMGLPTRAFASASSLEHTRTALTVNTPHGAKTVAYGQLLSLGGTFADEEAADAFDESTFLWFFRTGFWKYNSVAAVMRDWLYRMISWTVMYRSRKRTEKVWFDGGGFEPYDDLLRGDFQRVRRFDSFTMFATRIGYLGEELMNDLPPDGDAGPRGHAASP